MIGRPDARARELVFGGEEQRLGVEWRDDALACAHVGGDWRRLALQRTPVAALKSAEKSVAARERIVGRDIQQAAILFAGLLVAAQAVEGGRAVEAHFGDAWVEPKRSVETGDGLVVTIELLQRASSKEQRARRTWIERDRVRHQTLRVLPTAKLAAQERQAMEGFVVLGVVAKDVEVETCRLVIFARAVQTPCFGEVRRGHGCAAATENDLGRHPALRALPHRHVCGFEMAREAFGVEQRGRIALGRELRLQLCELHRIERQLHRRRLVGRERVRDEFGELNREQQARGDTAREGVAGAGEHRKPRPQRIARRRVGVARERVEEEVGQTMARQVLVERPPRCKDETLRRHAARLGFVFEVAHGGGIVVEQPEHAAFSGFEQPHPDVEQLRRDLEAAVERAEDEAGIGKPLLRTRGRALGDAALAVVGLVRVGKADDLLAVVALVSFGHDPAVGDQVIDIARAHRAGMAEIVHLHGRWPVREDSGPRVLGEALEVDSDIDLHLLDERRRGVVALVAHVDKAVECTLQAFAHPARIVGTERDRHRLEPRLVVGLEQSGREIGGRVRMIVGREVGHAYPVVAVALAAPERGHVRATFGDPGLGRAKLIHRIVHDQRARVRRDNRASGLQASMDLFAILFQTSPIAAIGARERCVARGVGEIGRELEQRVVVGRRLLVALELEQRGAAVAERFAVERLQCERRG